MIAETRVDAVDGKGHKKQFRFVIEAPTQLDNESWGCVLTMEGFSKKPHRIVGADSWQAVTLAVQLVEQMLTYFVEDGGKLYWEDGGELMRITDVVPRFPSAT